MRGSSSTCDPHSREMPGLGLPPKTGPRVVTSTSLGRWRALKRKPESKRRAKIVRPLTPAALDGFVEAPGNGKWMTEAIGSLKIFLLCAKANEVDTLAKEIGEVMLLSHDNYKQKYPNGGNRATGGPSKGKGGKSQHKSAARLVKELERLGAPYMDWVHAAWEI